MLAQLPPELTSPVSPDFSGDLLGSLISRLFTYGIALAGLFFFVRLVLAGFTYLTSMGDSAKLQAASQSLIHSFIGLLLVITAFFIAQLLSTITGINITTL